MRHILFELPTPWFSIPIMGYGLMIVLGFVFGIALAHWRARRCGENPEHIMNLGLLALIGGIGGARLFYVLVENPDLVSGRGFFGGLWAIVNVRAGGLVYYGGLLVAIPMALWYIRRKKLSARRILDILAPSLMLGLAFGRGGCFLNGCCWGGKCTLFDTAVKERAEAVAEGERGTQPSRFEKTMTASLVSFPYGSPAFDQQAQDLPWKIINKDGQTVGWVVPLPNDNGPSFHVAGGFKKEPKGPYVTIPLEFLRPAMRRDGKPLPPVEIARQSWEVIYKDGRSDHYEEHCVDSDDQAFSHKLSDAAAPESSLKIPVESIIQDGRQPGVNVNFSYLGRDEIRGLADTWKAEAKANGYAEGSQEYQAYVGDPMALASKAGSLPVYPAQLYGVFNGLLLCIVLTVFFRRRTREGQVFALMLILKAISRFLLEGIRTDTDPVFVDMTFSQTLSLFIFIAGVLMWMAIYYLPPVAQVPLSGEILPAENVGARR